MTETSSFSALAHDLEELFEGGAGDALSDEAFDALALRVFEHQVRASPVYAAFCEARGVRVADVRSWRDVPAVPASGFRHVDLRAGPEPEVVFRTSGTTGADGVRGRHAVPRLSLYRASLDGPFRRWVAPAEPFGLLSLVPSPAVAPESSLSTMIGVVSETMAASTRWLADEGGLVSADAFVAAAAATDSHRPVVVTGTAFGFVHLFDRMKTSGARVDLPAGSRVMETGGFKGRAREVSREALRADMAELLDVPADRVVGEYGMTELLSQLYEPVVELGVSAAGTYRPAPWLRARALDPVTLDEVPSGEEGILCFHDLANLGSVSVVLTEDVGSVGPDGVRLKGRAPGAEPRGCSLAVEDLLDARARVR